MSHSVISELGRTKLEREKSAAGTDGNHLSYGMGQMCVGDAMGAVIRYLLTRLTCFRSPASRFRSNPTRGRGKGGEVEISKRAAESSARWTALALIAVAPARPLLPLLRKGDQWGGVGITPRFAYLNTSIR